MARERYLLHEGEEEINKAGAEIKADTPKAKWENFWYYHKLHVLIAICVVFLGGFLIHDLMSKVDPDYQVAVITQQSYGDEAIKALQNEIAKNGKDLNSDGKVIVQISNYVIADDTGSATIDANMQTAGVTRLSADLSIGQSAIFITDDASFKRQQKLSNLFSYLDGSEPKEGATDYENMRVNLKDCKKLANAPKEMKDLSISLRVYQNAETAKDKGENTYFAASKKLFEQLTAK